MTLAELTGANIAYVFPGQGSQVVGMGQALYASSPAARATIDEANEVLGTDLSSLMFEGPSRDPERHVQRPTGVADRLHRRPPCSEEAAANDGIPLAPIAAAGHSLGEFTAWSRLGPSTFRHAASGAGARSVMAAAGTERPGGMAAVLGLDEETLPRGLCRRVRRWHSSTVANANCPGADRHVPVKLRPSTRRWTGRRPPARNELLACRSRSAPTRRDGGVSPRMKAITDELPWQAPAIPDRRQCVSRADPHDRRHPGGTAPPRPIAR
jgi:hypothetical protein